MKMSKNFIAVLFVTIFIASEASAYYGSGKGRGRGRGRGRGGDQSRCSGTNVNTKNTEGSESVGLLNMRESNKRKYKFTAAGVLSEFVEHASRRFIANDTNGQKNLVVSVDAFFSSELDAELKRGEVAFEIKGGDIVKYSCFEFWDSSRRGTIIKKDVACQLL